MFRLLSRRLFSSNSFTPSDVLRNTRNIGISAHIDSGKTTLTERILFYTGRIHEIHEVKGKDGVGAKMDSMDLEREKGITIQSAATYCTWKGNQVNIIDTPGHVDFTIEVERALRVLDGAIMVLCGVSGVQSQSYTVDRQMRRYGVPRVAFVNKLDRQGASPFRVTQQLRDKLKLNASLLQVPVGVEENFRDIVDVIREQTMHFEGDRGEKLVLSDTIPTEVRERVKDIRQELVDRLGDIDDAIAEQILNEEHPSAEQIEAAIRRQTLALKFTPVFCGSAFKNKGIQPLLDGVLKYLPSPTEKAINALRITQGNDELGNPTSVETPITLTSDPSLDCVALAFKLDDGRFGQLTYVRVYQGTLRRGDNLVNVSSGKKFKVPRLVRMHSNEMEDVEELSSGEIGAMFGVDCSTGDTFLSGNSAEKIAMSSMFVPDPVMSLAVAPTKKDTASNFSKALQRFSKEDPTFRVSFDPEAKTTMIAGMGELHLEIYVERMKREYKCDVTTSAPYVAYREAITGKVTFDYTHKKQSGGAGQFGRVAGYVEPLPPNAETKFEFVNGIVGNAIPPAFFPAIEKGFREAVTKGPLIGHPVWGVRVVLTDGAAHSVDSNEMAFRMAAMGAFRSVFAATSGEARPVILEPVMKVQVSAPVEFQGVVMGGLNRRKGTITNATTESDFVQIDCDVPLAAMFGYSTDLRSATQGKGEFSMEYKQHSPVPQSSQEELINEYKKKRKDEAA
ncbi:mitochondrial translation elongation factor G1 (EF-G1) [Andalucia godoyi]|uniref:Elongation factor G, mitochondrial n=1 Tax=Andalucia godoyi TaxID=505711 RepID=A0A8K0AGV5_ANDGO|nr:mitochondrial translation elongation factor G1 (EF-G1) [Andalucia godoyi]|eukprot:ANDGO_05698.mRNA.1 mitochondrial translation elongation factor G1 (EF-G1)